MRALRLPLIALVLLSAVWGYSWVFLKLGLLDAGPFTYAGLRTLLGGACLLLVLRASGRSLRLHRGWEILLLGLVNTTGSVGCAQWALVEGAANRTSILMFTMPFWTLLIAWPVLGERVRGAQWAAVACAAAGLMVVLQPWTAGGVTASTFKVLAASLFWSAGVIQIKRMLARAPIDLLSMTAWHLVFGALALLAIAAAFGERPVSWTPRFMTALLVTGLLSTAFGWVLWVYLLNKLPAGMASMMTLLVPVVAVTSTSWQLGEPLAPSDGLGIALILGGLVILTVCALLQHRAVTGVAAPE